MFKNILRHRTGHALMFSALVSSSMLAETIEVKKEETKPTTNESPEKKPKSIFAMMEELTNQMNQAFDQEFEKFNSKFKTNTTKPKVKITQDDNNVIISIQVPNADEKGIKIDAKKKQLKGGLNTADGSHIVFEVVDGRAFSIVSNLKIEQETMQNSPKTSSDTAKDDNKENKSVNVYQSSSSEYNTLPAKVANLEDAKVELKDNTLTIKLPKAESKWKKLEVK